MNFELDVHEHHHKMKDQIKTLEKTNLFDKGPVKDIHLYFFYVINQKLENYKRIDLSTKYSVLTKDLLLGHILKNKKEDGRKFNITGIYKYHFNPSNLSDVIDDHYLSDCFHSFNKVDDIAYEESIEIFQDYSSLFIILQNEKSVKTKRNVDQKKNKTIKCHPQE